MNEKTARVIIDDLAFRGKLTTKFYDSFWRLVEEELPKEGQVYIDDLGRFFLAGTDDGNFCIKFEPDSKFLEQIKL